MAARKFFIVYNSIPGIEFRSFVESIWLEGAKLCTPKSFPSEQTFINTIITTILPLYALRKLVSWLMFQLCPRTARLRGTPSEPLMFVWPGRKTVPLTSSVRTRLNLWLTELWCVHEELRKTQIESNYRQGGSASEKFSFADQTKIYLEKLLTFWKAKLCRDRVNRTHGLAL